MTRRHGKYADAVREWVVRLVFEQRDEYGSEWAAIRSVAGKSGMSSETLRLWVRRVERDAGRRLGLTTQERRLGRLLRGNKELRRANGISRAAAALVGAGVRAADRSDDPVRRRAPGTPD